MDERERPVEIERETTVINTGGDRGGGGTIAAVLVLLVLAVGLFLFFGGYLERAADEVDVNVNVEAPTVELPKVELPDVKIETPPAEPANKSGE